MVRMGKNPKGWRFSDELTANKKSSSKKTTPEEYPREAGRVSANVIGTWYTPLLSDLADESSEKYAQMGENATSDRHLFRDEETVEEFVEVLRSTSRHFSGKKWRVGVNTAKFERQLDEKYGTFLPLIKRYPQIETQMRGIQRKYAMGAFSPVRTHAEEAPLGTTSSVILLFMMHSKGIRIDLVGLVALFLLVGLQPWALVTVVSVMRWWVQSKKWKKRDGFPKKMVPVENLKGGVEILKEPVGCAFSSDVQEEKEKKYDVIVVGCGVGALYSSALLSRAGCRVLVLSPEEDASGVVSEFGLPFDVTDGRVFHPEFTLPLLRPALKTTEDAMGGVRFLPLGKQQMGYAHGIVELSSLQMNDAAPISNSFVLRPGGLAIDAALLHEKSSTNPSIFLHQVCTTLYATAHSYFVTKCLDSKTTSKTDSWSFGQALKRDSMALLDKIIDPADLELKKLCGALGLQHLETLSMEELSLGMLSTMLERSNRVAHYPVGGTKGLCAAFANVIKTCGGDILSCATVSELLCAPSEDGKTTRITGVRIQPDAPQKQKASIIRLEEGGSLLSHVGILETYYKLLPENIRLIHGIPAGLDLTSERRLHVQFLFEIQDEENNLLEEIGCLDYVRAANVSLKAAPVGKSKFQPGHSSLHVAFPSAKDPTFSRRFPGRATCVVTVEADDDVVRVVDTKPGLYFPHGRGPPQEALTRLQEAVAADLLTIYPGLQGHIGGVKIRITSGSKNGHLIRKGLQHTPQRFSVEGLKPNANSNYGNLYCAGPDLAMDTFEEGQIWTAWMAVNSILGYTAFQHTSLDKNVTEDLERFLYHPIDSDRQIFPIS